MVGVPGKSQGCHTCRKRKIKCDTQRPHCQKCIESGRECEGYDRYLTFIDRTSAGVRKKRPFEDAKPSSSRASSSGVSRRGSRHGTPSSQPPASESAIPTSTAATVADSLSAVVTAWSSVNPSAAYDAGFVGQFYQAFMPSNPLAKTQSDRWLTGAVNLFERQTSRALQVALRAVAVSRVGRVNGDQKLALEGRVVYCQALNTLQNALWSEEHMYADETLAAARCLAMFELFETSSGSQDAWLSHTLGLERLIYLRGPYRYGDSLDTDVLDGFRNVAMICSLVKRRSTYLANTEWCTIPWQGRIKRFDEKLFDKGLYVAGLMESFDRCSRMVDLGAKLTVLAPCLHNLEDVEVQLETWYSDLVAEYRSPLYWTDRINDNRQQTSTHFTDRYGAVYFPNMRVANAIMVYWALRVLTGTTISSIQQKLSQARASLEITTSSEEQPVPEDDVLLFPDQVNQHRASQRAELCANIFQSLHYFMRPDFGVNGTVRSLFPLGVAMDEMARQADSKIMWGSSFYAQIVTQKGINWPVGMESRNGQREVIDKFVTKPRSSPDG